MRTKNPGSYFEIPATDLSRSVDFYSYVFGFEFEFFEIHGNKMALFPLDKSREGISGGLAQGSIYVPSKVGSLIYLYSDDIDVTLERIKAKGGKILFPKTDTGDFGFVAEFEDSEGNRIGLHMNQSAATK